MSLPLSRRVEPAWIALLLRVIAGGMVASSALAGVLALTGAQGGAAHALAAGVAALVAGLAVVVALLARRLDVAELERADLAAAAATAQTELMATNAELERSNAELERSNAELEQFAYIASHDLSEPLRALGGFAGLLERRYRGRLDERADRYITQIVDGAERLQDLIDALLLYSRAGRSEIEREPVDLNALVATTLDALGPAIAATSAHVRVGELPVVSGSPAQLAEVFQNLLANALKFRSERTPEIDVEAEWVAGVWRITVADNGIGIAPEYTERVFRMFQRLNPRAEHPGLGIGLALCRRIVERHGGRISIEPRGQGGTAAHVELPAPSPEPAAVAPRPPATPRSNSARAKAALA